MCVSVRKTKPITKNSSKTKFSISSKPQKSYKAKHPQLASDIHFYIDASGPAYLGKNPWYIFQNMTLFLWIHNSTS